MTILDTFLLALCKSEADKTVADIQKIEDFLKTLNNFGMLLSLAVNFMMFDENCNFTSEQIQAAAYKFKDFSNLTLRCEADKGSAVHSGSVLNENKADSQKNENIDGLKGIFVQYGILESIGSDRELYENVFKKIITLNINNERLKNNIRMDTAAKGAYFLKLLLPALNLDTNSMSKINNFFVNYDPIIKILMKNFAPVTGKGVQHIADTVEAAVNLGAVGYFADNKTVEFLNYAKNAVTQISSVPLASVSSGSISNAYINTNINRNITVENINLETYAENGKETGESFVDYIKKAVISLDDGMLA